MAPTSPPGWGLNMKDPRKALFATCRALGMDEDARRDMLAVVVGVRSTKDLSPQQWSKVLSHLNKLTGHDNGYHGRKPNAPTQDKAALMGKIEAQLADMKLPWSYLTSSKSGKSMCQRLAGVDALEFATPSGLSKIVAALAYRQKKLASAVSPCASI